MIRIKAISKPRNKVAPGLKNSSRAYRKSGISYIDSSSRYSIPSQKEISRWTVNIHVQTPLIPSLGKILRAKTGNKLSRFFRHIFEHGSVKKILGGNLAAAVFAASLLQVQPVVGSEPDTVELKTPIVLSTEKGIQFPTENVSITQKYSFFHPGIDFDGITGDPIKPILRGKVTTIENSRFAYGKSVIIDHGNGISSRYAHLSTIEVQEGQDVTKDTKLGEMGATGRAFGDHLHLEVYDNGNTINPLILMSGE